MANIEQEFNEAVAKFRAGQTKSAEKSLLRINKRHPGIPDVLHVLGYIAMETERPKVAVKYLSQAVSRVPENASLLNLLGCAFHKSGEVGRAIETLSKAVRLDPETANTRFNLANALQDDNRLAEAAGEYRHLITLAPDDVNIHIALGQTLLAHGDAQAAAGALSDALKLEPRNPEVHFQMGVVYAETDQPEQAETHFTRALDLRPDMHKALCCLADVKHGMGQAEEASALLERAITRNAGDDNAHRLLAVIHQETGNFEKARASAGEALKLKPESAENLYVSSLIHEKSNDLDRARGDVRKGLKITPDHVGLAIVSARIAYRDGDHEKARDILQALPVNGDVSPDLVTARHFDLGRVHDRLGDAEEAFRCFTKGNEAAARAWQARENDKQVMVDYVDHHLNLVNADWISGWVSAGDWEPAEPSPVFVVGFPRSGTTLLDQILDGHPGIQVLEEEPMMQKVRANLVGRGAQYPDIIAKLTPEQITQLRRVYFDAADQVVEREPGALLVDKMPLNLVEAAAIHRLFPDARFVLCLRHPCDACLSCFMQMFELNAGMSNFLTLDDTTRLYANVMRLWQRYEELLPLKVFRVRYEGLVDDLEQTARELVAFLELPWDDAVLDFESHARTRNIKTPSYTQVTSGIYSHARYRWRRYEKHMKPYMDRLQPFIEAFGYAE